MTMDAVMDSDFVITEVADGLHVYRDGNLVAEMIWSTDGYVRDVFHTYVDPTHRAEGLGIRMMDKMIELAVRDHVRILPSCPFVYHEVKKHQLKYIMFMVHDWRHAGNTTAS